MPVPGEVPQEIGRAYVQVLVGCLERTLRHFRRSFEVASNAEKLTFEGMTGTSYSFDVLGVFAHPAHHYEVFLECKGHKDGSHVLESYKEFVAKAYATSVMYSRHRGDLFWFVTNVPFGSSVGRRLTSREFMLSALTTDRNEKVEAILGAAPVDRAFVSSLSQRVAVCIFTDSFVKLMGVTYFVRRGESVWSIIRVLHGGRIPRPQFAPVAELVGTLNNLANVNRIKAGQRLHIPWFGLSWD